ncbi:MAG: hypothetical protein WAX06_10660 [Lactococcus lactis]
MAKSLKSKVLSYGLVEIVETDAAFMSGTHKYQLVVAGQVKKQSADLQYIISEYEKLW